MNFKDLPVYREKARILKSLENHQVVIVESPTGSGKTTQIPLILHEAGYTSRGMVGVTQPRRIATLSVCDYIAKQTGSKVPGMVGYKMRFEDNTLPETRMKIMTDGTLLQEMKTDPMLHQYSVIMVDEAHERSLNIDFILGLLKHILAERTDFKVIISSATINAAVFSEYFDKAPIVSIDTPVYPVAMVYDPPAKMGDYDQLTAKIVQIVERAVNDRRKGDVLVFLSGEKLIKDTVAALNLSSVRKKLVLQPLYGRLSKEEQERIFIKTPFGKTKVVVSTNIAETSVTIEGITAVIDSGLAKQNFYNPRTFTSSLIETEISQASANQRRGRAGRTQPGTCYRLYPKDSFPGRLLFTKEEIYRTDLAEVVLRMAELGISDFQSFDFISPPGRKGILGAIETLKLLDALDSNNKLTSIGRMMTPFPLMPRHARMIVEAIMNYPDVIKETLIAAAFLSTNSPYLLPQGEEMEARRAHHQFRDSRGDFVAYLRLFNNFLTNSDQTGFCKRYYLEERTMHELVNIQGQLEDIVRNMEIPISEGGELDDYLCACARGLIQFVCVRAGRSYKSLTADRILIHPGSTMFRENPPFLVAGEIVRTSQTYARSVSPLTRQLISKTSKELALKLEPQGVMKEKKKKRDTSQEITIGRSSFPIIQPKKGKKKMALVDWNSAWKELKTMAPEQWPDYKGMKGILSWDGREILSGLQLNMMFKLITSINPKKDILSGIPDKNYDKDNAKHMNELAENMHILLKISASGKRKKSNYGIITLQTDGEGHYWFRSVSNFTAAVNESLASLEVLADQVSEEMSSDQWGMVNKAYRRVDSFISL
ncbi:MULTISPECIES: helicase-related protein [unclassified Oceanispirochaeta]|uniref:helicase-related protein n=1 Tax=unclassified Oceanispirochaeta TaxID=2635722 RepID=UPI000E08DF64|nr:MULTISPECIES: ATP-dependent RNA helicase [unclassified Oceanispirochaeta]MBF9016490.1 ATP-dependent RNA helicase [Oceanispirochaeta sp. M2]NPD72952.1 ATP-dependent RNA helicase [Oceanispirochaeta sp. M1]RDG31526.1 ATP-dependent RNA helicase [Oceanispirochaeta sp. M1]